MVGTSNSEDFWDQPYYWFTKTVFRAIGHWPYQSRLELLMCRTVLQFTYWIQIVPQIIAVIRHYDDLDLIMETMSSFITDIAVICNLSTFFFNSDKIQLLLEQVKEDWNIFPMDNGLQLLHEYTQLGKQRAILYSGGLYASWFVFVSEPVHVKLFLLFKPSNKTLPLRFAIPVDYGPLDMEKYYYTILVVAAVSIFGIVTVIVSADILLFLYAQHACGIFAALGFAIENLPVDDSFRDKTKDYEYQYMKKCVIIHHRTLEFSNTIEDIFCWNFFVMIGLNMIVISMTAVQVVTNLDAVARLFKTLVYAIALTVHLFIQCFMSQQIIDSSLGAQQSLMNARWYLSTDQTKQLLQFMIMRSQIPCQLTAGKVVLMSLNTFSSIIRTSVTYFTVFLDMQ
ncbi:odorant receptor 9a-like [Diachasma alloeum]|uniref:Odorant receptor n=1 Tax=Diachasma alloeum TaxID=454923 RepID=A0A4E0RM19_9HYME|nr:odorant receptor 9a-like [Diachasma alloeum]THK33179.1 odorant receptor 154 [Diachasma alloeum]